MSDGPHRSLPLKPVWKVLAERAAKAAYSADQVCEALPHALKKEFREAPLEAVRSILGGGGQGALFVDDIMEQLEAARSVCRGSVAGIALIDCAIEAVNDGLRGDAAVHAATANALDSCTRSQFHSVEEHYQREDSARNALFVRGRLDAAREQCDFGAIAGEMLTPSEQKRHTDNLPKRTGIDDGPEI